MAVYTHLSAEDLAELIARYEVGELISAKGIAEGVSNSNWLIETSAGRFILTMYERRIDTAELPFFLGLLDHLSARACPVPRTIHDRSGAAFGSVGGKAVALIEFLPGVSIDLPNAAQAEAVGRALAGIHLAAHDYEAVRTNAMDLAAWRAMLDDCGEAGLAQIDAGLPTMVGGELEHLSAEWPAGLPRTVIHADLFPDNVLFLAERVTGLIDFYFACTDIAAYDVAVTHAAWSFGPDGDFRPGIAAALLAGYESVRPLSAQERAALPTLARGAAMRFLSSRAYDWLHTPADALVTRKDPMEFARRLEFYRGAGDAAFPPASR